MKISTLLLILTRAFNFLPLIDTFYAFYVLIAPFDVKKTVRKRLAIQQYSVMKAQ